MSLTQIPRLIATEIGATPAQVTSAVELLDGVLDTVTALADRYHLMVITKGDLRDQEVKIERSGLARYFRHVEIVSDKHRANYETLLERHAIAPDQFLMVGNSLRSDILPVLELGAHAVYIPYHLTWAHEAGTAPEAHPGYYELAHMGELPDLLARLEE